MNGIANFETTFYLVIGILFLVILLLFAIIASLLYYFTKNQKNLGPGPVSPNDKKKEEVATNRSTCFFHENNYSQGLCAICEKSLCEICIKSHDKLLFCPEHYKTFNSHKWQKLETIKTTPETPMEGIDLYNFKHQIWDKDETPSYLVTQYMINVENDLIESYVTLFVREHELQDLADRYLSKKHLSQ